MKKALAEETLVQLVRKQELSVAVSELEAQETVEEAGKREYREAFRIREYLPITIFAIHGNHEQRPQTIEGYQEKVWHSGVVYREEEYPSLLFARDGEVFDLDGKQAILIGGAYSIDKIIRLIYGYGWWPDNSLLMRSNGTWRASWIS